CHPGKIPGVIRLRLDDSFLLVGPLADPDSFAVAELLLLLGGKRPVKAFQGSAKLTLGSFTGVGVFDVLGVCHDRNTPSGDWAGGE
ncbi:MAG: hypothetical protein ACI9MR_005232, partial [Myxococcota bacterium]